MKVEIDIHTYFYQRRLCWMLSSLLQQKGAIPELLVNISFTENDGNPTTKEVCTFFREKGLNILETNVLPEEIKNRSLARIRQLKETKADWILFADSDMVYEPLFFNNLQEQLLGDFKNETRCIGADRVSLDITHCKNAFDNEYKIKYPSCINNVAALVGQWPVYYVNGKNRAAGYFQLANVKSIRDRKIEYGLAHKDGLRRYRADRYFRVNMGGIAPMNTLKQFHLNHSRDNQEKIQR